MEDIESLSQIIVPHEKTYLAFLRELAETRVTNEQDLDKHLKRLRRKFHVQPSKNQLRHAYEKFGMDIDLTPFLSKYLIQKAMRSRSGVLVSTIVLKPDVFSCPKKCAYCPTETDRDGNYTQPKSYLSSEPAMMRALQYKFDVKGQLYDRIQSYRHTGNIGPLTEGVAYKLEIILSGGTFESYPLTYRERVMNEIYWAANTYTQPRPMLSLEEEIVINETAMFRIIGLTVETRPDFVTPTSIRQYQRWGVTRVQLGIQHYDDAILDYIQRDCTTADAIKAIRLLKQNAFKIVCHLMPDLPGSSPEKDRWMFQQAITNPDLQFDDTKIYPCAVCQSDDPNIIVSSTIADWYRDGSYKPYSEDQFQTLIDILKEYKSQIQPWVRIQRLVRDIPSKSIEAGYHQKSDLRNIIQDQMKKEGTTCQCIRCLEIDDQEEINPRLIVRTYPASEGTEYFISYEVYDEQWDGWYCVFKVYQWLCKWILDKPVYWDGSSGTRKAIIGFCRLRIDPTPGGGITKALQGTGMIRELHVYGNALSVGGTGHSSQHKSYGQRMMHTAEEIIVNHSPFRKASVIAGVGVRMYYKNKCGYEKQGTYMVKKLDEPSVFYRNMVLVFIFCLLFHLI
jgi:ELP3 family radical SAM enzyme/protein acetyltransferase